MTTRENSLRIFIWVSFGLAAWRLLTTCAYLLFGPAIPPELRTTQIFFYLSKAFLGGLFWPISLLIDGWQDPIAWLFYPW
ncbi:MAG: hypothetical protein JWR10_4387 [Rubritepida sp.]|nr:hypothetical protein [Rubritepida sp.]